MLIMKAPVSYFLFLVRPTRMCARFKLTTLSILVHVKLTIRYDTIEEINVDSKAEYTA